MMTATTQIMDYVKDFMALAIEEKWSPELIQRTWQEKKEDINKIVEGGVKTKKVSSPKDPNKPKRGKSAYIFFCSDNRDKVKDDLGDVKPQEIMKELGVRWKSLKESSSRKDKSLVAKYMQLAEDDKKRAENEMATYVPPTEEELLANKPKRGRKPSVKKSDKPKRGRSGYIFFCLENRQAVKEENPDVEAKEITKLLSVMWNDLKDNEDEELQKYMDMALEDKKRYEKEMETYQPSDDEEERPKKKIKVVKPKKKVDTNDIGFKKYVKANKEDYEEENPDLKPAQITKLMKEEWLELDDSERQAWADEEQE